MKPVHPSTVARMQKVRDAAALVSYSPDYVSRLAREEKIVAVQRGRDWYVDIDSLKLFVLETQAEKRRRQQVLREERLNEQAVCTKIEVDENHTKAVVRLDVVAVGLTAAVCGLLLMVGTMGHVVVKENLQPAQLALGAQAAGERVGSLFPWLDSWLERFVDNATETAPRVAPPAAVRVTASGVQVANGADASAVFSDDITLRHGSTTTMVLTPVFERESETAYTLQIVPVDSVVVTKNPL